MDQNRNEKLLKTSKEEGRRQEIMEMKEGGRRESWREWGVQVTSQGETEMDFGRRVSERTE